HVVRRLQHSRQQPSNAVFIVDQQDSTARLGDGVRLWFSETLTFEPAIEIPLAEAPLPADADRRDASGLDQTIDRTKVDIAVGEGLLSGEEALFSGQIEWHRFSRTCATVIVHRAAVAPRRSNPHVGKDLGSWTH